MSITNISEYRDSKHKKEDNGIIKATLDDVDATERAISIIHKCMSDLDSFKHINRIYPLQTILEVYIERLEETL